MVAVEYREVQIGQKRTYDENTPVRPTIIKWKDTSMIRNHSLGAAVQEILQASEGTEGQDVVNINLIGEHSSGKTSLAKTLGHLIHKRAKIPFSVRLFDKQDLLNFEATLKTLSATNYVLIFDDISFLKANASAKQIEMVKQAETEIRHLPGGQDVKIIIIKNFHYTLAVDKYLRQNDFSFFTTVGSSEVENMEKIVGSRYMGKVHFFKKLRNKIKIAPEGHKKFTFQLGSKGTFTYQYRKPFIPLLYWNGDSLRYVVSPTREWIDPVCSICSSYGSKQKFETEIDITKFKDQIGDSYGESTVKRAVLNILQQNGITADRPQVVSAERFIKKALEKKMINLDDLANAFELSPTITKMKKNVDIVLENSKIEVKDEKMEG